MAAKDEKKKIVVSFTQQQLQLLDKVKAEGRFGKTYSEVVLNIFRDYARQELGE